MSGRLLNDLKVVIKEPECSLPLAVSFHVNPQENLDASQTLQEAQGGGTVGCTKAKTCKVLNMRVVMTGLR